MKKSKILDRGKQNKGISRSILDNMNIGIFRSIPSTDGKFVDFNQALIRMFGYSNKKEFLRYIIPSDIYVNPRSQEPLITLLLRDGYVRNRDITLEKKDGSLFYARMTAVVVKDKQGKVKWFDGILEDVTDFKRQKERFKHIFQNSPVAIWEEDFSALAKLIKRLKRQKIKDVPGYFRRHPEMVIDVFRKIKILDLNKAALDLYGAKTKRELIFNFGKTFVKGSPKVLIEEMISLASGKKYFEAELKSKTLHGRLYDVLLRVSVPDGCEETLERVIVTIQNITERKKLENKLKRMALEDGLTKLLNARAISKRLDEEVIRAKRYNLKLAVLMIDIDYFKMINDKFGHQKGNAVLKRVSQAIKGGVRKSDITGRYGGDEFLVILPQTDGKNAGVVAARIRKLVSSMKLGLHKGLDFNLTISIGISSYPEKDVADYKVLISQADAAMYLAKSSGRDRVIVG